MHALEKPCEFQTFALKRHDGSEPRTKFRFYKFEEVRSSKRNSRGWNIQSYRVFQSFFPVKSITGFFKTFLCYTRKNWSSDKFKIATKKGGKKHWEVRFDAAAWRANRKLLSRLKTCHNHLLNAIWTAYTIFQPKILRELSIPNKGNNEYFFPSHLDVLVGHLQRVHALVRPHLLGQPELGVVDVHAHDEPGNKFVSWKKKRFGKTRRRLEFKMKVPGSRCRSWISSRSSSSSSLSSRVLGTAFGSGGESRTVLDFFSSFNMSEKCFVVLISRIFLKS